MNELFKILPEYANSTVAIIVISASSGCFVLLVIWRIVKENRVLADLRKNPDINKLTIGKKGEIHIERTEYKERKKQMKKGDKKEKD